jgi:hyperosmotically inducible protein
MQISVETYRDVVQLSGFVDSYDVKRRAGSIAMAVDGVKSVRNDLVVR